MPEVMTGWGTIFKCTIGGIDVAPNAERFEWKAMVNNGYIFRGQIADAHFNLLKVVTDEIYLRKARQEPVEVKFSLGWKTDSGILKTEDRIAYMLNLYSRGVGEDGRLEFIAIDPPTWLLSRGKAQGKHYGGSISDVIKQVCQENGVSDVTVSTTIDNKSGDWWMMRQDPKTFILSLLEWSSSITSNKTKWVVTSKDKKLFVKEEHDCKSEDLGVRVMSPKRISATDNRGFELLMDNFTHVMHSEAHTAGMSAISGHYIDIVTEKEKARAYDKNTGNKANTKIGEDRGFTNTNKEWSTFFVPIPEDSAGAVGVKYQDYIDGVARSDYLDMAGYVMRMKVTLSGDYKFDDPTKLGVSTVTLQWIGIQDGKPYFLAGSWLVTGFHHMITRDDWITDIYINRLDYNATARIVGPGSKGQGT
jgi:hypothetical protein